MIVVAVYLLATITVARVVYELDGFGELDRRRDIAASAVIGLVWPLIPVVWLARHVWSQR